MHWLACEFGDKWSLPVLYQLGAGSRRFLQLKRALGLISQRMLAHALKKLERGGFVIRTSMGGTGTRAIYALTDGGVELLEALRGLNAWMCEHGQGGDKRQDVA